MADPSSARLECRLVLASGSPRRLELLNLVGVEPLVMPVDLDETPLPGETATELALRLAPAKATEAAEVLSQQGSLSEEPHLIIAADTVVDVDGVPYGKPEGKEEARKTLSVLSGRKHRVVSGVSVMLFDAGKESTVNIAEKTDVNFRPLSDEDIEWYVSTGEPWGRSGAYAIQGLGSLFVTEIAGSYHNVMGLPLAALDAMMSDLGWPLRRFSAASSESASFTPPVSDT